MSTRREFLKRTGAAVPMVANRDIWWHDFWWYDYDSARTAAGEQHLLPEQLFQFCRHGCVHGLSERRRAESGSGIPLQQ